MWIEIISKIPVVRLVLRIEAVILYLAAVEVRSAQGDLWRAEHEAYTCKQMVSDAEVRLEMVRVESFRRRRFVERQLGDEFVEKAEAHNAQARKSFAQEAASLIRLLTLFGLVFGVGMLVGAWVTGGL